MFSKLLHFVRADSQLMIKDGLYPKYCNISILSIKKKKNCEINQCDY